MRVRRHGEPPMTNIDAALLSAGEPATWRVPEETPVAFVYNRRNYAVMLATPADLQDFALGFSLTERVIDAPEDVSVIDIYQSSRGVELHISIEPNKLERLDIRQRRRNIVGRAGCGICGLENVEVFFETLPRLSDTKARITQTALIRASEAMGKHQPLNQITRTVHAAAWAGADGDIIALREDVGRHNALDKLLGALALDQTDRAAGFVLMSSRCSYEIIEKAAHLGVRAVASISAPTAFAIRKAQEANIALYCRDGSAFVEILGP